MPKRAVMTVLVRDEIDVVRQNIDFYPRQGVDFDITADNEATDGTHHTFHGFAHHGALRLIDEVGTDDAQHRWASLMAMLGRDEYGVDRSLNSDTDEFWSAPGGPLRDTLDIRNRMVIVDTTMQDVLAPAMRPDQCTSAS